MMALMALSSPTLNGVATPPGSKPTVRTDMFDLHVLIESIDTIEKRLAQRGFTLDKSTLMQHLEARKKHLRAAQNLQEKRNSLSKQIGVLKAQGKSTDELMASVKEINVARQTEEDLAEQTIEKLNDLIATFPNVPHPDTPTGNDEEDNVTLSTWGTPKTFDFEPKDHVVLGEAQGGLDFETAAAMSGSRFVIMKGPLARLHRALSQFMLDMHVNQHGYEELNVPFIVHESALFGTGQLPKFRDDQFFINDPASFLIPTAEVPITNMVADQIVPLDQLPMKYVAHTPCFRKEAGAYGKDTRGMIRMHQFEKVEMVQITTPEQSEGAFKALIGHAKAVLEALELPYREQLLCSGDLGFSANRTVDLEVWIASQKTYREISSCSHFDSFQTRRLKARFRANPKEKTQLLHTINGSGLAVGRTMVALMEYHQTQEGHINIPKALQPHLGGLTQIENKNT